MFAIEINDNPNLDVGAEDKGLGDEVYRRLLGHLLAEFEACDATTTPVLTSAEHNLNVAIPVRSCVEPSPFTHRR